MYEQWTSSELAGRSKGTGTSDHPELLLPPGWEEAMADLAKEEKELNDEKELSVSVKESGSGISRDEVETSSSSYSLKKNSDKSNHISYNFQHQQVGRKCVVDPVISGLLPTLAKGCN